MKNIITTLFVASSLCVIGCADGTQPLSSGNVEAAPQEAASVVEEVTYQYKGATYKASFKVTGDTEVLLDGPDNARISEIMELPNTVTEINDENSNNFVIYENPDEAELATKGAFEAPTVAAKLSENEVSINIDNKCKIWFFENTDYRGRSVELNYDNKHMFSFMRALDFEDITTSLKFKTTMDEGQTIFHFWEHPGYNGKSFYKRLPVSTNNYFLRSLSSKRFPWSFTKTWNNKISSARCYGSYWGN